MHSAVLATLCAIRYYPPPHCILLPVVASAGTSQQSYTSQLTCPDTAILTNQAVLTASTGQQITQTATVQKLCYELAVRVAQVRCRAAAFCRSGVLPACLVEVWTNVNLETQLAGNAKMQQTLRTQSIWFELHMGKDAGSCLLCLTNILLLCCCCCCRPLHHMWAAGNGLSARLPACKT
jgi:hypothetical protein